MATGRRSSFGSNHVGEDDELNWAEAQGRRATDEGAPVPATGLHALGGRQETDERPHRSDVPLHSPGPPGLHVSPEMMSIAQEAFLLATIRQRQHHPTSGDGPLSFKDIRLTTSSVVHGLPLAERLLHDNFPAEAFAPFHPPRGGTKRRVDGTKAGAGCAKERSVAASSSSAAAAAAAAAGSGDGVVAESAAGSVVKTGEGATGKGKGKDGEEGGHQVCPICQEELVLLQQLRRVDECGHCFHAWCLDEWLEKNSTCPMCRLNLHDSARRLRAMLPPPEPSSPGGESDATLPDRDPPFGFRPLPGFGIPHSHHHSFVFIEAPLVQRQVQPATQPPSGQTPPTPPPPAPLQTRQHQPERPTGTLASLRSRAMRAIRSLVPSAGGRRGGGGGRREAQGERDTERESGDWRRVVRRRVDQGQHEEGGGSGVEGGGRVGRGRWLVVEQAPVSHVQERERPVVSSDVFPSVIPPSLYPAGDAGGGSRGDADAPAHPMTPPPAYTADEAEPQDPSHDELLHPQWLQAPHPPAAPVLGAHPPPPRAMAAAAAAAASSGPSSSQTGQALDIYYDTPTPLQPRYAHSMQAMHASMDDIHSGGPHDDDHQDAGGWTDT
ncbi:unnamed protein product [Vitrella brassicaformis CCMP3155]|uniref:RING-type domain-containing protein n=2 Tax=Vitrella brassicaformis TaxID=1169539 RepID=A0A0G4EQV7_VITBC|nr:unnamed protein product [Vitrella brassicaformis CCMP3155]|eukprot:CEM00623.1 unnamed protein product [Vitrella brassicaformis CCMP3155]